MTTERKKIERAVRNLVAAEVERAWMGAKPPEDHEAIIRNLKAAKQAYRETLHEVLADAMILDSAKAHEVWAAAQLAPGEGIEDGVARIQEILKGAGRDHPSKESPAT